MTQPNMEGSLYIKYLSDNIIKFELNKNTVDENDISV